MSGLNGKIVAFCSRPFGLPSNELGSDSDFRQLGTLSEQADGRVFVTWAPTPTDGIVPATPTTRLSCQPDGKFQTRTPDHGGEYEVFSLIGDALVIRPNWRNGAAIFPSVPTVVYVTACKVIG